jgi:hypothetical protein
MLHLTPLYATLNCVLDRTKECGSINTSNVLNLRSHRKKSLNFQEHPVGNKVLSTMPLHLSEVHLVHQKTCSPDTTSHQGAKNSTRTTESDLSTLFLKLSGVKVTTSDDGP